MNASDVDRFWSKVYRDTTESGCWIWTAGRTPQGYGVFHVGREADGSARQVRASRFAWELEHGPIPDGVCVLHTCDNPPCVRHLFLGTKGDNNRDRTRKGRGSRGTHRWNARLTPEIVRALRRRYRTGERSQHQLAREYGIGQTTVWNVLAGRTWRHVTDEQSAAIRGGSGKTPDSNHYGTLQDHLAP